MTTSNGLPLKVDRPKPIRFQKYKHRRFPGETNAQCKVRLVKEREQQREQPLPAPFAHRDGNWWSGVIDDYIEATKRDKIDD